MTSSARWPCAALQRASLGPRTTLRVGGTVEWLLEPATPDELARAFREARERGFRPRVLGGGANLIVADGLHPGVVVATERMARVFRPEPAHEAGGELFEAALPSLAPRNGGEAGEGRLVAWAGAGMPGLVRTARELGWTGLEGLVGVPGHLGGGVAMNAGGRWGELWDAIELVRLLTPDGEVVDRAASECTPSYRDGNLGDAIAVAAVLRLTPDSVEDVRERMRGYLAEKSAVQPVTERSCGCIFKNPDPELSDGRSAGRLIEDCGGKELARGAVRVSEKHANFVVNQGGASASDVLALIDDVRRRVRERSGIELQQEARVWAAGDP